MEIAWLKNLVRLYLPIYQFESDKMKIVYAGYSSIKRNYFTRILLSKYNYCTFKGRKWFWQIPELIKSYNLDMVVSEISPNIYNYFQKSNGYIVPTWVTMRININRPMSEVCQRSISDFSDVKRKIRKYCLTYEIQSEKINIKYFIDNFYLPYITKRHKEEAWIENLSDVLKSTPSPLLMTIKEGKEIVGAALFRNSDESLFLMRLGLLDGNEEYRQHGVIGSIYYFGILEGQIRGCRYLDVGGTRPFLTDGLTKFKIGLGAEFVSKQSPAKDYLWVGVNEHSTVASEFIKKNPFMHVDIDFNLVRVGINRDFSN
jgi:hypothetical protein